MINTAKEYKKKKKSRHKDRSKSVEVRKPRHKERVLHHHEISSARGISPNRSTRRGMSPNRGTFSHFIRQTVDVTVGKP